MLEHEKYIRLFTVQDLLRFGDIPFIYMIYDIIWSVS